MGKPYLETDLMDIYREITGSYYVAELVFLYFCVNLFKLNINQSITIVRKMYSFHLIIFYSLSFFFFKQHSRISHGLL